MVTQPPNTSASGGRNPHMADRYGESFADVYDEWYSQVSDASAFAKFVQRRSGGGFVLELGVGNGRLALPLCKLGPTVVGLDASKSMLDRCPKSAGNRLILVRADMRALPFGPEAVFGAVVIGFNTIFNLVTEADQQGIFYEAMRLLQPGGFLIIEAAQQVALDQQEQNGSSGHSFGVTRNSVDSVVVASTAVNPDSQIIDGCHIQVDALGVKLRPWKLRWLSSQQMDTLGSDAGFALQERYANWVGDALTATSANCVSVYRKAI